jgi:His-Xaa-Ser system protein HxsD
MPTQEVRVGVVVQFAAGIYPIDAIKRAAYRFADKFAIDIEPRSDGILCTLLPTSPNTNAAAIEADFRSEVLDQDLRLQIAKETEPLRNLILSLAFSKTGLQE